MRRDYSEIRSFIWVNVNGRWQTIHIQLYYPSLLYIYVSFPFRFVCIFNAPYTHTYSSPLISEEQWSEITLSPLSPQLSVCSLLLFLAIYLLLNKMLGNLKQHLQKTIQQEVTSQFTFTVECCSSGGRTGSEYALPASSFPYCKAGYQ